MFTNNYEKNDIIMIAFGCIYVFDVFPTKTPKTWVHPKAIIIIHQSMKALTNS